MTFRELLARLSQMLAAADVQFIVAKDRDFSREEFQRRQVQDLDGLPFPVASPEDVIIAKLEWAKLGESGSSANCRPKLLRPPGA